MQSVFRLYARTSKGNDAYLYQQLVNFGLKPKYEDLFHSFYFDATFHDIFRLSFSSLTVENMFIQLGKKYELQSQTNSIIRTNETKMTQFFKKIQFKNYIPIRRNIIKDISLKVVVRESSFSMPSERVIGSLLQNQLQKEIIMKEYKQMLLPEEKKKQILLNHYDIKEIVERKWHDQDQLNELINNNQIQHKNQYQTSSLSTFNNPQINEYNPHLVLYIKRNTARLLLKMNKSQLYKHGWKKQIGWAPIRQSLTASILYRSGIITKAKQSQQLKLWDPFCGSGTIPLVACSMFADVKIRQNVLKNFTWPHWQIYKENYLTQFLEQQKQKQKLKFKIIGSDISLKTVNNAINNFKEMLSSSEITSTEEGSFISSIPNISMAELLKNQIYFGCGDFQQIGKHLFTCLKAKNDKINIITNLPYLNQRSKDHHPKNQLYSIYKRFNSMIREYREQIQNVFVLIGTQNPQNYYHFLNVSKEEWRLLSKFNNGGIEVGLYGWAENSFDEIQHYRHQIQVKKDNQNLQQYKQKLRQIEKKEYLLPKHISDYKSLKKSKRVKEKRRARHLRVAYALFSRKREKREAFQLYARKELAEKLTRRGKSWRKKNMSVIQDQLLQKQTELKKQFQTRITEALKKSEEKKQAKKIKKSGRKVIKHLW